MGGETARRGNAPAYSRASTSPATVAVLRVGNEGTPAFDSRTKAASRSTIDFLLAFS